DLLFTADAELQPWLPVNQCQKGRLEEMKSAMKKVPINSTQNNTNLIFIEEPLLRFQATVAAPPEITKLQNYKITNWNGDFMSNSSSKDHENICPQNSISNKDQSSSNSSFKANNGCKLEGNSKLLNQGNKRHDIADPNIRVEEHSTVAPTIEHQNDKFDNASAKLPVMKNNREVTMMNDQNETLHRVDGLENSTLHLIRMMWPSSHKPQRYQHKKDGFTDPKDNNLVNQSSQSQKQHHTKYDYPKVSGNFNKQRDNQAKNEIPIELTTLKFTSRQGLPTIIFKKEDFMVNLAERGSLFENIQEDVHGFPLQTENLHDKSQGATNFKTSDTLKRSQQNEAMHKEVMSTNANDEYRVIHFEDEFDEDTQFFGAQEEDEEEDKETSEHLIKAFGSTIDSDLHKDVQHVT
ncbi:hypothetical protein HAX54_034510, partial [Datura stramonium]|nr:hypothetical protein [Datura stramonium]